jgi:hypothetical protein
VNPEPVNAYPKTNTIQSVLLALLLIAFMFGVGHLFVLRFQTGDVYPAYSSLRSDPLGTRVLYESLENLGDIGLGRNYRFLHSLKPETDTTLFYLGISADDYDPVPQELIEVFDRLTQSGGRLVVSFLPINRRHEKTAKPKKEPESQKVKNVECREKSQKNRLIPIKKHWGIGFEFNQNLPVKDGSYLALDAVSNRRDLPPIISWHSNLYFDLRDKSWQVLYTSAGHPVMIERPFGKGSLVMCADSFFISNEALRSERHPQLLVWLLGHNAKIIFDETHFGIYTQPSVAALLRHYRFHWVFLVLTVMALLFVWKNAVYFVPPRKDNVPSGADVVSDKDYTRGLIAMLRRNIPDNEILQVCGQEWERTFKKDKRVRSAGFRRVKEILQTQALSSKKRMDAAHGYRKISRTVQRTRGYE